MERIDFIAQALEVNIVQASLLSEMIKDIPDEKLKDFFVFRMRYIEPMMSKEVITKNALFDYRRIQFEQKIKSGEFSFESPDQLQNYLQTYYKGKEIGNGIGGYYDYVVIAIDKDGNFINKFVVEEFGGKYKKLSSDDVANVINDLFTNQHKIGSVQYIPYHDDVIKLEAPKRPVLDDKSKLARKTLDVIADAAQKVKV